MSIQETLRLEEKLNASFNNENDPTKAHIINCMCVATNTADTVESFAQSSDSFGELCRNYLHYVPNGIAESSIITYLTNQLASISAVGLIVGSKNCALNSTLINVCKYGAIRVVDCTYKHYFDKYYNKVLSVVGDRCSIVVDEGKILDFGNIIDVYEKDECLYVICNS